MIDVCASARMIEFVGRITRIHISFVTYVREFVSEIRKVLGMIDVCASVRMIEFVGHIFYVYKYRS